MRPKELFPAGQKHLSGGEHFVGRAAELQFLGSLLDDVQGGQPRVVIVAGEPDVGKSRLLEYLQSDASNH